MNSAQSHFELSVVICTHNRARDAAECATALLAHADAERLELIVIDNASRPCEREQLRGELAQRRVRLVDEPTPGLSFARNRGLSLASAPWLAYLDDDALPFDDWVPRALGRVRSAQEPLALIAGAVFPRWPDAQYGGVDPARLGERWRTLLSLLETENFPAGASFPQIVGCNFLVNRRALAAIGGFSGELGRAPGRLLGGEEIEVARRLSAGGSSIEFDAALRVYHKIHAERLTTDWIRRRAEAEGELLWKCDGSRATAAKVLLSVPYLALGARLRTLPSGTPTDYDHHVRLWHNLGFLKAALAHAVETAGAHRSSSKAARSESGVNTGTITLGSEK